MSENPVCSKCEAVEGVAVIYREYKEYLDYLEALDIRVFTDHSRGYHEGRIRLAKEITDALLDTVQYLETLLTIRVKQGRL